MSEPVTMEHLLTHTTGFDYVDPRPEDIHYQDNDYTMLKDYVEDNMPTVVRKPGIHIHMIILLLCFKGILFKI